MDQLGGEDDAAGLSVTFVEAGGRGGVYQHTLAVAEALAESGVNVTLISADDAEVAPKFATLQRSLKWHRGARFRSPRIVASYFLDVLPQAMAARGPVWVQGGFKTPLTAALIGVLRLGRRRVIFSPHNLFVRSDESVIALIGLRICVRWASVVVAYNEDDFERLQRNGRPSTLLPLLAYAPPVVPDRLERWCQIVHDEDLRVAALGQIREDKNLEVLIEACARADRGLLIAGQDRDGTVGRLGAAGDRLAARVHIVDEYLELDELVAMLIAVGCVALPYTVASQSAVASLARAYGAQIVGNPVGGLAEQLSIVVQTPTVDGWTLALRDLADSRWRGGTVPTPKSSGSLNLYKGLLRVSA